MNEAGSRRLGAAMLAMREYRHSPISRKRSDAGTHERPRRRGHGSACGDADIRRPMLPLPKKHITEGGLALPRAARRCRRGEDPRRRRTKAREPPLLIDVASDRQGLAVDTHRRQTRTANSDFRRYGVDPRLSGQSQLLATTASTDHEGTNGIRTLDLLGRRRIDGGAGSMRSTRPYVERRCPPPGTKISARPD